jgi:hypothetical protein
MIECFVGRPGQGKTLTMMHYLSEELLRTERYIVTNIPLCMPELAEYMQRETDRRKVPYVDLNRRLLQISNEEALGFWRFRPGGYVLPPFDGRGPDGKVYPEQVLLERNAAYWRLIGENNASNPTTYFISEAHRYFNAKRFQQISVIAELYVTHHRHLHDDVYFDTQYPGQLAVPLRQLVENWHVLRNDYNRKLGIVKMVPKIKMKSYMEVPSDSSMPFETRNVYIKENGVASCYNSTGALGAIERAATVEAKRPPRGIPMRVFIGLIVAALLLFMYLLYKSPLWLASLVLGRPAVPPPDVSLAAPADVPPAPANVPPAPANVPPAPEVLRVSGYSAVVSPGSRPWVTFGNGVFTVGDETPYGRVRVISEEGTLVQGMLGPRIVGPVLPVAPSGRE